MLSYWGVDHGEEVSKAESSRGRKVLASTTVWHGAVAGKKGKKLRATANQAGIGAASGYAGGVAGGLAAAALTRGRASTAGAIGGGVTGWIAGSQHGLRRNERKGYLKPQVAKNFFETEKKPSERRVSMRPMTMNTRHQNARTGAKTGAAEFGALGAAVGATLTRGKGARAVSAARGAAYGAAGGGVYGAGLGAIMPNQKSRKASLVTSTQDKHWENKQAFKSGKKDRATFRQDRSSIARSHRKQYFSKD